MKGKIPEIIKEVAEKLKKAGFEAYLVGGCVRDLLLSREPKDWDITTNAKPEEILRFFPDSVYENNFGTVGIKTRSEDPKLKIIEITTFRVEGKYSDKRHPDEVRFAETLEEDLSRRDFTVNALAMSPDGKIVDPFGGQKDLKNRMISCVGEPEKRFEEDALRLFRAVRFAVELDFEIDFKTRRAIEAKAGLLEAIAKERIRDEFIKILMCDRASAGIILLEQVDLLRYVCPELREGLGVGQNKHHIYTVFEHNVRALDYAAKKNYSLEIRMAALLHDVAKPKVKQGDGPNSTFYNHDLVGAKITVGLLDKLRFSRDFVEHVAHLVKYHLFYYNVGEVTDAGVRRFLNRVGPEYLDDLIKVREADRIGSGVPKAVPYKLRHLLFMIDKVRRDPVSPKMLKVDGKAVMEEAGIPPSPKVGQILAVLLEEVLEDPSRNDKSKLIARVRELNELSEKKLAEHAFRGREKAEEFESGVEEEMKKKHYVK
jgi:tRNA nucleotidyltransferase/poly(A) polymerase